MDKKDEVTMTTLGGSVYIFVDGIGTVSVNWGDGSEIETRKFVYCELEHNQVRFIHKYPAGVAHTITITGENTCTVLSTRAHACAPRSTSEVRGITSLTVNQNKLTALDVSRCTALNYLDCHDNQLTTLDVSLHTALKYLDCGINELTELDVSKNTGLKDLHCYHNEFKVLDVSKNTALKRLDCGSYRIEKLIVNQNCTFSWLCCAACMLEHLDVSRHTPQKVLDGGNIELTLTEINKGIQASKYVYCFPEK